MSLVCANFVLQATNAQGLETMLGGEMLNEFSHGAAVVSPESGVIY